MLEALDHGIEAFGGGVGDAMMEVIEDATGVFVDEVGDPGEGLELGPAREGNGSEVFEI